MRLTSFALAALLLASGVAALTPSAAAATAQPVPVGVCVAKQDAAYGCYGDHDVCVSGFSWVPQCADIPCYRPADCSTDPCESEWFDCTCDPSICEISGGPAVGCVESGVAPWAGFCVSEVDCDSLASCEAACKLTGWCGDPCDIECNPASSGPGVPVGVCVAKPDQTYGCFRDGDVCVSAFSWVPQCADVPCYRPNDCFTIRDPCDLICSSPCDHGACEPAGGPSPPWACMDVYREVDLGVVRVIMRDSCSVEVEQRIFE